jgi:uncharacterized surface protein with fasciclin (FAS1) repeats
LAATVQYHIVADEVTVAELAQLGTALSTSGQTIAVALSTDGMVLINNAAIVEGDIQAANGMIHIIDSVLLLPAE